MSQAKPVLVALVALLPVLLWLAGCSDQRETTVVTKPAARASARALPNETAVPRPRTRAEEPLAAAPTVRKPVPPAENPMGDRLVAGAGEGPTRETHKPAYAAKRVEFDPVETNGKVFVDWPKPKLAIVLSGQQNGYLEPCGCAGLTNMKGGLMRRHTLLKSLTAEDGYGWPAVVALDLGNLVRRFGWQATQKYESSTQALKTLGYDAIAFGPDDLRLGIDPLVLAAADNEGRYVAANVALFGFEDSPTSRDRVIERGGYKIGVTSVLGETYQLAVSDDQIQTKKAAEALAEVMPKLTAVGCDLLILLSHATVEESKALARQFPQFDIVVTAGGPDEPPFQPERQEGTGNWLVETGKKGMYVNVIGLYDDAETPRRFQRVPIDSRYKDSPEIKKLMVDLQEKYKQHYLQFGWAGLGIKPLPHPSGRTFVGSEHCADCHTTAHGIWAETPHSHATESLTHLDPPRQYDPECVSCHSTGWEPQKFFPFKSGFDSLKKTAHLTGNGCENCHGPGSRHVAIEEGEIKVTAAERREARKQMRVTIAQAKDHMCAKCHDLDNSPDYIKKGFDAYWPHVEHKGRD